MHGGASGYKMPDVADGYAMNHRRFGRKRFFGGWEVVNLFEVTRDQIGIAKVVIKVESPVFKKDKDRGYPTAFWNSIYCISTEGRFGEDGFTLSSRPSNSQRNELLSSPIGDSDPAFTYNLTLDLPKLEPPIPSSSVDPPVQ